MDGAKSVDGGDEGGPTIEIVIIILYCILCNVYPWRLRASEPPSRGFCTILLRLYITTINIVVVNIIGIYKLSQ